MAASSPSGTEERSALRSAGLHGRMPSPASGLSVRVYADAPQLWGALLDEWERSPAAQLVFASAVGLRRFQMRRGEETLWDDRAVSLGSLTGWAQQQLRVTRPRRRLELQAAVTQALRELPSLPAQLRELAGSPDAVGQLRRHLDDIEAHADRVYRPGTDIERGVQALREYLAERELVSELTNLSRLSREAKELDYGRPLLFAPSAQPTRHLAGFWKGFAVHQPVTAYLLCAPAEVDTMLAQAGLTDVQVEVMPASGRFASRLFSSQRPSERDDCHIWVQATDEQEAAVDCAWRWTREGVPADRIAIVCQQPDEHAARFAELAVRRDLPLYVRERLGAFSSSLGALLVDISRTVAFDDDAYVRLLDGDGARWGLTAADLDELGAARTGGPLLEARVLQKVGERLLDAAAVAPVRPELARAHAWLSGLAADLDAYEESGLMPDNAEAALLAATGPRAAFGEADGVVVLDYSEAAGVQFTHGIFCSLQQSGYPVTPERSPFVSDELYDAVPELHPVDSRPEFSGAVAAAYAQAAFICRAGEGDAPGPYWAETLRAATPSGAAAPEVQAAPGLGRQRVLQRLARHGAQHHDLTAALPRARRDRVRPGALTFERDHFAVTELELYLQCPWGWFVRHVLSPSSPSSAQQRRGNLLHEILDGALGQPPAARAMWVRAQVDALVAAGALATVEAATEKQRLVRVIERYAGPSWPFARSRSELKLRSDSVIPGATVVGRADRVDVSADGVLVIDYKRRRRPAARPQGERLAELQRYLYPKLAAEQLSGEPLGMVYVSVFHGAHDGSLTGPVGALAADSVDYEWVTDAELALERARAAIDGIRAGAWGDIGRSCPDWCPHRLVSRTVEGR